MANPIYGYGFRWVKSLSGECKPPIVDRFIASAATFATYSGSSAVYLRPGDPVKLVSDGSVTSAEVNSTTQDAVFGIVACIYPYWDSANNRMTYGDCIPGGPTYSTNYDRQTKVGVIPVPNQVFAIHAMITAGQATAVTPTTRANWEAYINELCDMSLVIDATNYKANPKLDMTSHSASTTAGWRVLAISPQSINNSQTDWSLDNVEMWVTANETQSSPWLTTGV